MTNVDMQDDRMLSNDQQIEADEIIELINLSSQYIDELNFKEFSKVLRKIYNKITRSSMNYDDIFKDSDFPTFLLRLLNSFLENDEFEIGCVSAIILTIKALIISSKEMTQFFIENDFIQLSLKLIHPPLNTLIGLTTEVLVLIIKDFPSNAEFIYSHYDYSLIYELLKTYLDFDRMNKLIKTMIHYINELIKNDYVDIPNIIQILSFSLSFETDACNLILLTLTNLMENSYYSNNQLCEDGILDLLSTVLKSATDRDIISISHFYIFLIENEIDPKLVPIDLFFDKLESYHSEEAITIILKLFEKISVNSSGIFIESGIVESLIQLVIDNELPPSATQHASIIIANSIFNDSAQIDANEKYGLEALKALSLSIETLNLENRIKLLDVMIILAQKCKLMGQAEELQDILEGLYDSDDFDPMGDEDDILYHQLKEIAFPGSN